ncbi:MAG: energy-coupling factor transporter transmembrane component T [Bacillota bacterium]|nr:energy-coupling factor transporter transmembrane component T [Bacillota bacterium]
MNGGFKNYHPIVSFIYFVSVIGFAMFIMHPVFLAISIFSACLYSALLNGTGEMLKKLKFVLPLMFFTAVLNPLFNHRGNTIIAYFKSGNPLTLESVLYGIAAGLMLSGVIYWFACFNEIMTTDKLTILFGRIAPSFSLVLSMTLRFVPEFSERMKEIALAQKGIGRNIDDGNIIKRAKHGIKMLSILITWSLEAAIDNADSMRSRGYGLGRRTSYQGIRFSVRDKYMLSVIFLLDFYIVGSQMAWNVLGYNYFDNSHVIASRLSLYTISAYLILSLMPVFLCGLEGIKWKRS